MVRQPTIKNKFEAISNMYISRLEFRCQKSLNQCFLFWWISFFFWTWKKHDFNKYTVFFVKRIVALIHHISFFIRECKVVWFLQWVPANSQNAKRISLNFQIHSNLAKSSLWMITSLAIVSQNWKNKKQKHRCIDSRLVQQALFFLFFFQFSNSCEFNSKVKAIISKSQIVLGTFTMLSISTWIWLNFWKHWEDKLIIGKASYLIKLIMWSFIHWFFNVKIMETFIYGLSIWRSLVGEVMQIP
jgi:hypothetical protein